ncbi:MAG: peptide-methionine (S)-S-oxide reductase MsrA [Isosphaeraceae bacterium]|nr:peptide-methionine (S)-S-oxide reductase MsrA [Isosphaeraceae bacterium]
MRSIISWAMVCSILAAGSVAAVAGEADEPSAAAPTEKKPETKSPSEAKDASKPGSMEDPEKTKAEPEKSPYETATFGGGCFWSIEAIFERIPGVVSVVSGFSGGSVPNPTYQMVGTGRTGHAEVVHITFDSRKVDYPALVRVFFKAHDPTQVNMQGDDVGPQYRSVIFHHSETQRKQALAVHDELVAKKAFRRPTATQLVPFEAFYPAEKYHQDFFTRNPYSYYSRVYIIPKLTKMKLRRR